MRSSDNANPERARSFLGWLNAQRRPLRRQARETIREDLGPSAERMRGYARAYRELFRAARRPPVTFESLDWEQVLARWGVERGREQEAARAFRAQIAAYGALGAFGAATAVWAWRAADVGALELVAHTTAGVVTVPLAVLVALSRAHRIACIRHRHYIPFRSWLLSRRHPRPRLPSR